MERTSKHFLGLFIIISIILVVIGNLTTEANGGLDFFQFAAQKEPPHRRSKVGVAPWPMTIGIR